MLDFVGDAAFEDALTNVKDGEELADADAVAPAAVELAAPVAPGPKSWGSRPTS